MIIPIFKCRCSGIGQMMTESRDKTKAQLLEDADSRLLKSIVKHDAIRDGLKSKANEAARIEKIRAEIAQIKQMSDLPPLSQTAKTFCKIWLSSQIYGRKKDFSTRETQKGNAVESDAIDYAAENLSWGFVAKNTRRKSNQFIEGEADVVLPDTIADTKCSFNNFTFPLFETEIPEEGYEWQLRGYMILYQKLRAELVYCLMDTPDEIIDKEARFRLPQGYTQEEFIRFRETFIFSHFPKEMRLKVFEIKMAEEVLEKIAAQIYSRVFQCREYLNELAAALPFKVEFAGE
jgi:hypothetical protein